MRKVMSLDSFWMHLNGVAAFQPSFAVAEIFLTALQTTAVNSTFKEEFKSLNLGCI